MNEKLYKNSNLAEFLDNALLCDEIGNFKVF